MRVKAKQIEIFEMLGILLILEVTVFYTGLRSGILSILFANILFLIAFLIFDFKQKEKYLINFFILIGVFFVVYGISTNVKFETSRINVISDKFIYETNDRRADDFIEEKSNEKSSKNTDELVVEYVEKLQETDKERIPSAYVKEDADILEAQTNQVVGTCRMGQQINGFQEGDYFYFDYDGQEAKISKAKIIFDSPKLMYVNKYSNIRNYNSKKTEEVYKGKSIYTVLIGDYYRYWDNGVKFIYKDLLQIKPVMVSAYTTGPTDVRNADTGKIIDEFRIGSYIEGIEKDEFVYFKHNKQIAKIHRATLTFQNPQWLYINSAADIRNDRLEKIGQAYVGKPILAVKTGDYNRYFENEISFIHEDFVSRTPIAAPTTITANYNVEDAKDKKIKTVKTAFIEYLIESDQTQQVTEDILREDVKYNTQQYLVVEEPYQQSVANYTIRKDRYVLWTLALGEIHKSPIFGQGPLFYQLKYDNFFPHNIILEILTDFGIVGLVIFLSLAIFFIVKIIKIIIKKKDMEILLISTFGLSYIPTYLLYSSLYRGNSLVFLVTLLIVYVILNKKNESKIKIKENIENKDIKLT